MEINIKKLDHLKIISLTGELNAITSAEVESKILQLIMGGNKKLIIDLEQLSYISSAGLRIFLVSNKLIRKMEGEIRICCLNHTVKEVFEISGFNMIFKVFPDQASAIESFK